MKSLEYLSAVVIVLVTSLHGANNQIPNPTQINSPASRITTTAPKKLTKISFSALQRFINRHKVATTTTVLLVGAAAGLAWYNLFSQNKQKKEAKQLDINLTLWPLLKDKKIKSFFKRHAERITPLMPNLEDKPEDNSQNPLPLNLTPKLQILNDITKLFAAHGKIENDKIIIEKNEKMFWERVGMLTALSSKQDLQALAKNKEEYLFINSIKNFALWGDTNNEEKQATVTHALDYINSQETNSEKRAKVYTALLDNLCYVQLQDIMKQEIIANAAVLAMAKETPLKNRFALYKSLLEKINEADENLKTAITQQIKIFANENLNVVTTTFGRFSGFYTMLLVELVVKKILTIAELGVLIEKITSVSEDGLLLQKLEPIAKIIERFNNFDEKDQCELIALVKKVILLINAPSSFVEAISENAYTLLTFLINKKEGLDIVAEKTRLFLHPIQWLQIQKLGFSLLENLMKAQKSLFTDGKAAAENALQKTDDKEINFGLNCYTILLKNIASCPDEKTKKEIESNAFTGAKEAGLKPAKENKKRKAKKDIFYSGIPLVTLLLKEKELLSEEQQLELVDFGFKKTYSNFQRLYPLEKADPTLKSNLENLIQELFKTENLSLSNLPKNNLSGEKFKSILLIIEYNRFLVEQSKKVKPANAIIQTLKTNAILLGANASEYPQIINIPLSTHLASAEVALEIQRIEKIKDAAKQLKDEAESLSYSS